MRLLPIVERELRVAVRRRSAFWVRVMAAATAVGVGGLTLWFAGDWGAAASQGRPLFEVLTWLAFAVCVVAGPALTADMLSEEKREGTLGFLFLTDLRAHDVVLGKLAAASVAAVFSLLAVLPVVALSLLLGGVDLGEFGRMALVLLNCLWFSLAAGMLMSALCQEARSAFALTTFLLFLSAGVAPWLLQTLGGTGAWPGRLVAALGPAGALLAAPAPVYAATPEAFWLGFWGAHLEAWLMLAGAARLTGRAWREATTWGLSERWQARWRALLLGDTNVRQALRRRLLDRNPLLWLGSRQQLKRNLLWGLSGLTLVIWLGTRVLWSWQFWSAGTTLLVGFFLQAMLKWLAASEAAWRLAQDRRTGALELLLTTGLGQEQIVRGQMQAMRRLFGPPVLAVVVAQAALVISGEPLSGPEDWAPVLVTMVLFVWDMPTLAWAGLWYSVSSRRPQLASLRAIFRVLVVPWLVFLGVLFILGVWSWAVLAGVWLVICGVNNHAVRTHARFQLQGRLREAAAGLLRTSEQEVTETVRAVGLALARK